jgi:hypothetical protein
MMQTQVNPALQALMQTAQMVTPERGPTVAAKVAQAAQQKMQPQAAPPGIEALLPGAGVQAAQSAQAAQPATQGDLNRLRQMMAQAPQGQGIAAGADVQMAEGGVVGFAGDGEFGSSVPDPSAIAMDELHVDKFNRQRKEEYERQVARNRAYRQQQEILKQKAAEQQRMQFLEANAPETAAAVRAQKAAAIPNIPEGSDRRLNIPAGGIVSPGMAVSAPAPTPAGPRKLSAATQDAAPAMALPFPDTRESTTVNPSESAVNFALARGDLKDLRERLSKPTPETPEQQAYRKAQEDQYKRGIAAIGTQRQRFEDAEAARKAGLSNQARENLISFMTRVGGAGSLFRGMGQASRGMEPIIAAQRAAEQAANDKKIQYFDLLDQRKETVEGLKLAALKGDADRVAAETARLRAVDAEIAKLGISLTEKQAGQQHTGEQAMARTQAEISARAEESEKDRRARAALQSRPGPEQQMIERAIKSLMDANPGMAYHEAYDKARGSGRGMDLKETSVELRALKDEQQDLDKRLESAMTDSQKKPIYEALDRIAQRRRELMGAAPTSAEQPPLPPQAVSQLKEGVVTKFANGQQWTLRNGQPTQVK